jgi:hypothetical protein
MAVIHTELSHVAHHDFHHSLAHPAEVIDLRRPEPLPPSSSSPSPAPAAAASATTGALLEGHAAEEEEDKRSVPWMRCGHSDESARVSEMCSPFLPTEQQKRARATLYAKF